MLREIESILRGYPGFLPGALISVIVAGATRPFVARALQTRESVAFVLLLSLGLVASATLTPSPDALAQGLGGASGRGPATCDFHRLRPASPGDLLSVNESGFNVLLFVPLGMAIALLPRSRRKTAFIAAAIALPFAIETTQLMIPALGRACQSSDVVDNLTGVTAGFALGAVAGLIGNRRAPRPS